MQIYTVGKQVASRSLLNIFVFNQEDTEPTIDGRDVSGLSPVVSTMMVMANPLETCVGGPLPATTPLPTLVEA